ncbi:MAG: MBL fold metallo-hydrolase [Bryobacterales bacterium]|nr:MBL fold metallo-hydrolase [Bryobacterales bacterium]
MRLTRHVYLAGSGLHGFSLSNDYDCHVYVIDGGSELALIDAGAGLDIDAILANIRFDGLDPARLRYLLLTHAHADHAGGARGWYDRFGVEVAASPEAGRYLRDGDEERISLAVAKQGGFYPASYVFRACPVPHILKENDMFSVGELRLRAIETPGHCSGMLSFLLEEDGRSVLFSGDTVFHDGKWLVSNLWDCDIRQYVRSIEKLAAIPADVLLPGHLSVALKDGARHVRKAWDTLQRLSVPPSIV